MAGRTQVTGSKDQREAPSSLMFAGEGHLRCSKGLLGESRRLFPGWLGALGTLEGRGRAGEGCGQWGRGAGQGRRNFAADAPVAAE